jgi:rubrerythrin
VNLQEAIVVALEFETKVRDHYLRGAREIADPRGQRLFATLAKEEQGHVDYLDRGLAQWKKTGKVADLPLTSVLAADVRWFDEAKRALPPPSEKRIATRTELDALETALHYETESDAFYHRLVAALPEQDRPLFDKFLRVEDGHRALVQAQLELLRESGFWFDVAAFIQDG